jgi:hypothetical protein
VTKLPAIAMTGIAGFTLAGAALAAGPAPHVMNVPLPDGSTVRVEYVGNVAPKVTVAPRPLAAGQWAPMALPSFGNFDQMIRDMNRQTEAMMRQVQQMSRQPVGSGGPYVAAYGNMPQGSTSTSVVTISNGGGTCTRTTEVVSQGAGKPPKVTTSVSGQCAGASSPAPPAAPPAPPERLDHT